MYGSNSISAGEKTEFFMRNVGLTAGLIFSSLKTVVWFVYILTTFTL